MAQVDGGTRGPGRGLRGGRHPPSDGERLGEGLSSGKRPRVQLREHSRE